MREMIDEALGADSSMRSALLCAREALYWFIPDNGIVPLVIAILVLLLYTLTRALPTMERLGTGPPSRMYSSDSP